MGETLWKPRHPESTAMWQFLLYVNRKYNVSFESYHQLYQWSINHISLFWQTLCEFYKIHFNTPPEHILKHPDNLLNANWFQGAHFNFAEKLLQGKDQHTALIALNEKGKRRRYTYKELRDEVALCAAALKNCGIQQGDRVAAVMPNVPETIIAMLATASLGAVWSSCSPDFGAQAIIDRLGQIQPKLLFICDGHQYQGKTHSSGEKITLIAKEITSISNIVIIPFLDERLSNDSDAKTIKWQQFMKQNASLEFTPLPFNHPLYILYSSGTTGKPKCIIHGAGGTLLQHIKELGLHTDIKEDDNLFFYTTCGWMMWNWMVSVLSLGATLTLYEGSPNYPDPSRLFQIIEDEQISVFGTSAKYISSIEKAEMRPRNQFKLQSLRCILSTGSPLLPQNYDFVYQHIKEDVQLSSISGGTDIISCFALGNPILPVYRGEIQCIGLGMAVDIFNEQGQSLRQTRGELVCTKPFPSMPVGFWNDPERIKYKKAYFDRYPNIWAHGDFAELTEHHGLVIYGRSDAVLNPGGVRIGTAEIYRQVEKIPQVIDCVVIGQEWQDDIRIILFVKLKEGISLSDSLKTLIQQTIRKNASPRHVPAKVIQVKDIPRTLSGKIVELAVKNVVHGHPVNNIESLANPESLQYFKNHKEVNE